MDGEAGSGGAPAADGLLAGSPLAARRSPSMSDVAKLAGVSHQTVSRVVNGHPHVTEPTRQAVLTAIGELGYRRNSVARALVTGRSSAVGVISLNSALYGPASMLHGLQRAARSVGYGVSISSVESFDRRSIVTAVEDLMDQSVAGIVVIAPLLSANSALLELSANVPVVAVEGGEQTPLSSVNLDQRAGARQAVGHLLALGHATVAHIGGPREWLEAEARRLAWEQTLAAAGAPPGPLLPGDWSARSGYLAARELARDGGVTAVFAANDSMALGALRAFHEAGVRVPQDLSVCGFDDVPEAGYFTPPLTTVRQDFIEVGRRSLALLLHLLEGRTAAGAKVAVPPELIVRSSTAGPAGRPPP